MENNKTSKSYSLRLNDQLCFSLYSTSRAITKKYSSWLKDLGLTYPQYLSMLALWENDGLSIQGLSTTLELEPATVTPLVKLLEKNGLIERRRSLDDERFVHIFLTDDGRALRQNARQIPYQLGCALGVEVEEAEHIITLMRKLRTRLK